MIVTKRLRRNDYRVGLVCALPIELEAVCAMLDEQHQPVKPSSSDANTYQLGLINDHPVAVTCLPVGRYGISSATSVVENMKATFTNIEYCLMVGVGGGIPDRYDIRLGDVVVASPGPGSSGVITYRYGKMQDSGEFLLTGSQSQPPEVLLRAIPHLTAITQLGSEKWKFHTILEKNPLAKERKFACPGASRDRLFRPEYSHQSDGSCCETARHSDQLVQRDRRADPKPVIHYGNIGSADIVVKDAGTRDKLGQEYDLKCFETEAAGIVNSLPCLTIRGICDYADSHKNKCWQPYAALTAAAYAKGLLSVVQVREPPTGQSGWHTQRLSDSDRRCMRKLASFRPAAHRRALQAKKGPVCAGTCRWFLHTKIFETWKKGDSEAIMSKILWLSGLPGTGKTVMSLVLAEELEQWTSSDGNIFLYFFCDTNDERRNSAIAVVSSFIFQLVQARPYLQERVLREYQEVNDVLLDYFHDLWMLFIALLKEMDGDKLFCIIDAIDECDISSQKMLLGEIVKYFGHRRSLGKKENVVWSDVHILVTSRPYREIEQELKQFPWARLGEFDASKRDVKLFIRYKVSELVQKCELDKTAEKKVLDTFQSKAEGSFLWVAIVAESLKDTPLISFSEALEALPQGLNKLYSDMLKTAIQKSRGIARQINLVLDIIAVAQSPLTIRELSVAINLERRGTPGVAQSISAVKDIVKFCRLLVVEREDVVTLLHKSVRDFLFLDRDRKFKAHADMAYRCIRYLVRVFEREHDTEENVEPGHPAGEDNWYTSCNETLYGQEKNLFMKDAFRRYSTSFWMEHAGFAQDEFTVKTDRDCECFLTTPSSPIRERWMQVYRLFVGRVVPNGFTIFHIAARWGILPLLRYNMGTRKYEEVQHLASDGTSPLEIAAQHGHDKVVEWLITNSREGAAVLSSSLEAAANFQQGALIMARMLANKEARFAITRSILRNAAGNEGCGPELLELILKNPGIEDILDDSVLVGGASNQMKGPEVVQKLFKYFAGNINETVAVAAARNEMTGVEVLRILKTKGVQMSMSVILAAASNRNKGIVILRELFPGLGGKIEPSQELWCALLRNQAPYVTGLLRRSKSRPAVTDKLIKVLAGRDDGSSAPSFNARLLITPWILDSLLNGRNPRLTRGALISMTEFFNVTQLSVVRDLWSEFNDSALDFYIAAVKNRYHGVGVLRLLQSKASCPIRVTEAMITAAVSSKHVETILPFLLDHAYPDFPITAVVLRGIFAQKVLAPPTLILRVLFQRSGGNLILDNDFLHLMRKNEDLLQLALIGVRDIWRFTARVLQSTDLGDLTNCDRDLIHSSPHILRSRRTGFGTLDLALSRNQDKKRNLISITPLALEKMMGMEISTVATLMAAYRGEISYHKDAILRLVRRADSDLGLSLVKLAIEEASTTVTEELLVAAGHSGNPDLIEFLMGKWDRQNPVTLQMVNAATKCGPSSTLAILRCGSSCDPPLRIRRELIVAALQGWPKKQQVIESLANDTGNWQFIEDDMLSVVGLCQPVFDEKFQHLNHFKDSLFHDLINMAIMNKQQATGVLDFIIPRDNTAKYSVDQLNERRLTAMWRLCPDHTAARILAHTEDRHKLTVANLVAAIQNTNISFPTIKKIFHRVPSLDRRVDQVVKATIHAGRFSHEILELLSCLKEPLELRLTRDLVEPVVDWNEVEWYKLEFYRERWNSMSSTIANFLNEKKLAWAVTPGGRKAILRWFDHTCLQRALQLDSSPLRIDDEMITLVLTNKLGRDSIIRLLLTRYEGLDISKEAWYRIFRDVSHENKHLAATRFAASLPTPACDDIDWLIRAHVAEFVPTSSHYEAISITPRLVEFARDDPLALEGLVRLAKERMEVDENALTCMLRKPDRYNEFEQQLVLQTIVDRYAPSWDASVRETICRSLEDKWEDGSEAESEDAGGNKLKWERHVCQVIVDHTTADMIEIDFTRAQEWSHHSPAILTLLLENESRNIVISEAAMSTMIPYLDPIIIEEILNNERWDVSLTDYILLATMNQKTKFFEHRRSHSKLVAAKQLVRIIPIILKHGSGSLRMTVACEANRFVRQIENEVSGTDESIRHMDMHSEAPILDRMYRASLKNIPVDRIPQITPSTVSSLFRDLDKDVLLALLKSGISINLTEQSLCWLVRECSESLILLALDRYGNSIDISERVIIHAIFNRHSPVPIIKRLLKAPHLGTLTPAVLVPAACKSYRSFEIFMTLLTYLQTLKPNLWVSAEVVLASLKNLDRGASTILQILMKRNLRVRFSKVSLIKAIQFCPSERELVMVDKLGGSMVKHTPLTTAYAVQILDQQHMEMYLSRYCSKIALDPAMTIAAARNPSSSACNSLLNRSSASIDSVKNMIPIVCENFYTRVFRISSLVSIVDGIEGRVLLEEMRLLAQANPHLWQEFYRCNKGVSITGNIANQILNSGYYDISTCLDLLVSCPHDDNVLRAENMHLILRNWDTQSVISLLEQAKEKILEVEVSKEALLCVVESKNAHQSHAIRLLLDHCRNRITIDQEFIHTLESRDTSSKHNDSWKNDLISVLLEHKAKCLDFTDRALSTILNSYSDVVIRVSPDLFQDLVIFESFIIGTPSTHNPNIIELSLEYTNRINRTEAVLISTLAIDAHRYSQGMEELHGLFNTQGKQVRVSERLLIVAFEKRRSHRLLEFLLPYFGTDGSPVKKEILRKAAEHSFESLRFLMDSYYIPKAEQLDPELVIAAAANKEECDQIFQYLFSIYGDLIPIPPEATLVLVKSSGVSWRTEQYVVECLRYLLIRRGRGIIHPDVFSSVIEIGAAGNAIIDLLISWGGFDIFITEATVKKYTKRLELQEYTVFYADSPGPLEDTSLVRVLRQKRSPTRIELGAVTQLLRYSSHGLGLLLLERLFWKSPRTSNPKRQGLIVLCQDKHQDVDQTILVAVAMRESGDAMDLLNYLLSFTAVYRHIDEAAALAAAGNRERGFDLLKLLVEHDPSLNILTSAVLATAAENKRFGRQILEWVIEHYDEKLPFSELLMIAIVKSPLPRCEIGFRNHYETISDSYYLLQSLLGIWQSTAKITEQILITAAQNVECGEAYLELLLEHPRTNTVNLQTVAAAIAEQQHPRTACMLRLLFLYGAHLDEDLLTAIVGNVKRGEELMSSIPSYLFATLPRVSRRLVSAAQENSKNGTQILDILLKVYSGPIDRFDPGLDFLFIFGLVAMLCVFTIVILASFKGTDHENGRLVHT